jgi:PhnB protein
MNVQPIPEGYHTLTPSLTVRGGAKAIDFYKNAFGAKELCRMLTPDGKVMHAEIQIGDSRLMLSDESPEWGNFAPEEGKGASYMLYVQDCDAIFKQAVDAGATVDSEPADMFWGDRSGRVTDPFGYRWMIATHIRDVSPEEIAEAAKNFSCGDREK